MIEEKVTPWKTNLIGALVEFAPERGRGRLFARYGLHPGSKGVITDGEWVSNYTMGTAFCAYNILWMGIGSSRDFGCKLAHFSKRDFKVIALSE